MDAAYAKLTQAQRDEQTRKVANQMAAQARQMEQSIIYLDPALQRDVRRQVEDLKMNLLRIASRPSL